MELKIIHTDMHEDQDLVPLTIQNYEDLTIKVIHDRKKLSEVWKYYGILFNRDSIVNPHRYYCSLCLKELHENLNSGSRTSFSSIHNVSMSTATGNLKMHLFKGHNINTFPDTENKKLRMTIHDGIMESGNLQNGVNYITSNSFSIGLTDASSSSDDTQSMVSSYSRLRDSLKQHIQNFDFVTVLSEIWFNPIISNHYLKLSTIFVDSKWDIINFTLCHAPLKTLTNDNLRTCYESLLMKFNISNHNCGRVHMVCTKRTSHMPFVTNQDLCVVFLTHQLITKEGFYSSAVFRNILSKCLNIIYSLNTSSLFIDENFAEGNFEFLNDVADIFFICKFDEQSPLFFLNTEAEEKSSLPYKHIMRTSVMLHLLKHIQKYIIIINQGLSVIDESQYCINESDINFINNSVKFLEQLNDVPGIFDDCNNSLIVVPVLKKKIKEICELHPDDDRIISEIKTSMQSHLDEYYPMNYFVKMSCILDPSVRDILDKEDVCDMLINRLRTSFNGEDKNSLSLQSVNTFTDSKQCLSEDTIMYNHSTSKKLKLFESLKPQYQISEYEDKFGKEVRQYMQHVPTVEESEMPLLFWKTHSHKYPNLSLLAKEYLSIPACSLPPSSLVNVSSLKSQIDILHISPFRMHNYSDFHNNLELINRS